LCGTAIAFVYGQRREPRIFKIQINQEQTLIFFQSPLLQLGILPGPGYFKTACPVPANPGREMEKTLAKQTTVFRMRMHNEHFFILSPFKRAL
jgi:hypothetical protein